MLFRCHLANSRLLVVLMALASVATQDKLDEFTVGEPTMIHARLLHLVFDFSLPYPFPLL
jgi:hypothetical protein